MSVIGISPSDIVRGVAVGHKVVTALKDNENGARQQYQQAKRALSYRVRALEDLTTSSGAVLHGSERQSEPLLDLDRSFQQSLGSYEEALGRGSRLGAHHETVRKLRYAFDGQKDVQAHLNVTKPAVDAAIFRQMQLQVEIMKKHQEQSSTNFHNFMLNLNERLDQIQATRGSLDHSQMHDMLFRPTRQRSLIDLDAVVLADQSIRSQPPASRVLYKHVPLHKALPRRTKPKLKSQHGVAGRRAKANAAMMKMPNARIADTAIAISTYAMAGASIKEPVTAKAGDDCYQGPTSVSANMLNEADEAAHFIQVVLCAIFAVTLTASYQHSSAQRLLASMLQASRKDPFFAAIFACMIAALARCFMQVPRQMLLLADDSISLETALGESLKVPSCYWKAHGTFHGFLEAHFNDRPGHKLVSSKSYRILLGGIAGQVIDFKKWTHVVIKRMKLTMAVVLQGEGSLCPKCKRPLPPRPSESSYCQQCKSTYSFLKETLTMLEPQLPTAFATKTSDTPLSASQPRTDIQGAWNQNIDFRTADESDIVTDVSLFVNIMLRMDQGVQNDADLVLVLLSENESFEPKTILVPRYPQVLWVGRQTNAKTIPTPSNGYFDSKTVSRRHAEIGQNRGLIWIRDVRSSNGTFLNGQRLSEAAQRSSRHNLRQGDVLQLGADLISEGDGFIIHHKVTARVDYAGL